MKSKEVIRLIQEADPSGEEECCVGNVDIWTITKEPAYYDGPLQVLEHDPAKAPYYDICGGKYVRNGCKIQIRGLSIHDAIFENPKLKIDYAQVGPNLQAVYATADDETRKVSQEIHAGVERDIFVRWAIRLAERLCGDVSNVESCARRFYDDNLSPDDPMPEDIRNLKYTDAQGHTIHESFAARREAQWSREITVEFTGGFDWTFTKALKS